MPTEQNFAFDESAKIELVIRREYSAHLAKMIALEKWVSYTIGKIVDDDNYMYRCKTRIKTIESVLNKIEGKKADELERIAKHAANPGKHEKVEPRWTNIEKFSDLETLIEDWVGCRVITFLDKKMLEFHESIINDVRFKIIKITVHDQIGPHQRFMQFTEVRSGRAGRKLKPNQCHEKKYNTRGYAGIHYIIEPGKKDNNTFGRFELQTRTLLQECWGDVQHKLVYKGKRMSEIDKYAEHNMFKNFESLAKLLTLCDEQITQIVESNELQWKGQQWNEQRLRVEEERLKKEQESIEERTRKEAARHDYPGYPD